VPLHRVYIGQDPESERRARIKPDTAFRKIHRLGP
jgi:hypothetical protein